jgi:hypothetical protein
VGVLGAAGPRASSRGRRGARAAPVEATRRRLVAPSAGTVAFLSVKSVLLALAGLGALRAVPRAGPRPVPRGRAVAGAQAGLLLLFLPKFRSNHETKTTK